MCLMAAVLGGCMCPGERVTSTAYATMASFGPQITACMTRLACTQLCADVFGLGDDAEIERCEITSIDRQAPASRTVARAADDLALVIGVSLSVTYVEQASCGFGIGFGAGIDDGWSDDDASDDGSTDDGDDDWGDDDWGDDDGSDDDPGDGGDDCGCDDPGDDGGDDGGGDDGGGDGGGDVRGGGARSVRVHAPVTAAGVAAGTISRGPGAPGPAR